MLLFYRKLLEFFKGIFTKKNKNTLNSTNLSETQQSLFKDKSSLIFTLENETILILVNIPETLNKKPDEISILAENYANFIISICNDSTYNTVINLLQQKFKTEENILNRLFLENVLYFAPILKDELEKEAISTYINNKQPLVRPIDVFKYATK